jgi:hypothetical protein
LLPKDIESGLVSHFRDEIPLSQTKIAAAIKDGDSGKVSTLDYLQKSDLGVLYADDSDEKVEDGPGEAEEVESNSDTTMQKRMNACIKNTIPNIIIRRRYRAYLGCDKMTAIAKRAGVKKQTLHKQFARITNKISKMFKKRYDVNVVSITPFKLKKAGGTCRLELGKKG